MSDYIEDAHRTVSDKFYTDRIHVDYMFPALRRFAVAAENLDFIKKAIFYGKGDDAGDAMSTQSREENEAALNAFLHKIHLDRAKAINILHGIIGKATEVGEMVEALLAPIPERDAGKYAKEGARYFDLVNAIEEVGDGLWYDALILKACGVDFETAQTININKLRTRFPDRFTEHDATHRDLSAERATLEGGAS